MRGETMAASEDKGSLGLGRFILDHRLRIGLILIAITAFMAWEAAHVRIATRFENFFPSQHPDTLLYRKYQIHYGGAQTLIMMVRVKNGDIFNYNVLKKIRDITHDVNILPGVDHNEVFSLASYRVSFAKA